MEGVHGFVSKRSAVTDLPLAFDAVARGECFVSECAVATRDPQRAGVGCLSTEALIILRGLRRGRTYVELARQLRISTSGVEYHVRMIKKRLGLPPGRTKWDTV
jgi:DNA-binding NarL/FixJ family response regulator